MKDGFAVWDFQDIGAGGMINFDKDALSSCSL